MNRKKPKISSNTNPRNTNPRNTISSITISSSTIPSSTIPTDLEPSFLDKIMYFFCRNGKDLLETPRLDKNFFDGEGGESTKNFFKVKEYLNLIYKLKSGILQLFCFFIFNYLYLDAWVFFLVYIISFCSINIFLDYFISKVKKDMKKDPDNYVEEKINKVHEILLNLFIFSNFVVYALLFINSLRTILNNMQDLYSLLMYPFIYPISLTCGFFLFAYLCNIAINSIFGDSSSHNRSTNSSGILLLAQILISVIYLMCLVYFFHDAILPISMTLLYTFIALYFCYKESCDYSLTWHTLPGGPLLLASLLTFSLGLVYYFAYFYFIRSIEDTFISPLSMLLNKKTLLVSVNPIGGI